MSAETFTILTHDARNGLVWPESARALKNLGHQVSAWEAGTLSLTTVRKMFSLPPERSGLREYPALFLSINFHGLDKRGEVFDALRDKGVPVAVWCVDNPWNLLSGLRSNFWQETRLFVTDPSFIPGLRRHGARHVSWLPLATDTDAFTARPGADGDEEGDATRVVFVGRSAFPDKERFFVGQNVPGTMLREAASLAAEGIRPDFSWWLDKLYPGNAELWPGSAVRRVSLGAEESSQAFRAACLREAARLGLTVYGDAGWADMLPAGRFAPPVLRPPVDYYAELAAIYASAPFSLAVTSLLLPHGLNQRHFDVWAAGGFCLTDNTPGLDLFPPELAEPVTFRTPADIPDMVRHFSSRPAEKRALADAWRKHIFAEHTYDTRMRGLLKTIFS